MRDLPSLPARTLWAAAGALTAAAGRFVAAILVARLLGPALMGRYAFLVWCVEFAVLLATAGLPGATGRYLAELIGRGGRARERFALLRWVVRRLLLALLAGLCALYWIASTWLVQPGAEGVAHWLALLLVMQAAAALVSGHLSGLQAFPAQARINLLSGLILITLQPPLTAAFGLSGALAGFAASAIPSLAGLRPLVRIARTRITSAAPRGLVGYAFYTGLSGLLSAVVWARAELFFLERLGQAGEAGYFSVGLSLSILVTLVATLLTAVLHPHFAHLSGQADRDAIQRDYGRFVLALAGYGLPAGLVGAAVMHRVVPGLFGEAYLPATGPAVVLMISAMLTVTAVNSSLLAGLGHARFGFYWGGVGAALMVAGCLLFVPEHGAMGAVWVRLGVQAFSVVGTQAYIHTRMAIAPPWEALSRLALAAGIGGLAALVASHSPWLPLAAGLIAGGLAYLLALRWLRAIPREEACALLDALPRGAARRVLSPTLRWLLRG